jgi:endonuclease-8
VDDQKGSKLANEQRVEGPSIHLAADQLRPFVGKKITAVSGNSRIGIERLNGKRVKDIFAWGKHLVFQYDSFAMRIHFMLWGTFAATVKGRSVTGDYRRSGPPRLVMNFPNGEITIWAASVKWIEDAAAKTEYDFSADIISTEWNPRAALKKTRSFPHAEIADVLLDQAIFAGVGNIIKNEVLFRTRTSPFARVEELSAKKLRAIVADAQVFSQRFLELRKIFALRKNLEVYRKSTCVSCGAKIVRRNHGQRARRSFFCPYCQKVDAVHLPITASKTSPVSVRVPRASAASRPSAASTSRGPRGGVPRSGIQDSNSPRARRAQSAVPESHT